MYLELCRSKSTGGDELKYETKDGFAAGYKATTSLIWPLESLGQQTNQIVTLDTSDGQAMYHSYESALVRPRVSVINLPTYPTFRTTIFEGTLHSHHISVIPAH